MNQLYMIIGIISFFIGMYIGHIFAYYDWSSNSKVPRRILYKYSFYKVIKIDDNDSWELAELHKQK